MPRFYFNFRDGRDSLDEEGYELKNSLEACKAGVQLLCHTVEENPDLAMHDDMRLEVTDPTGLIISTVQVIVTTSPAFRKT
ncbi:MAG: hypothetical protein WA840_18205 [Caulobacteraceae bacterium]|jgi:hypothetical protein